LNQKIAVFFSKAQRKIGGARVVDHVGLVLDPRPSAFWHADIYFLRTILEEIALALRV